MEQNVLFLNDEEVRDLLTQQDVLSAVEETFKSLGNGRIRHPRKEPLWLDEKEGCYENMLLAMPGWLMDEQVAGVKWINMFFKQKPGYPSSLGNLIVLNQAETGAPYALVEASAITTMRTGGGHAVIAAKYLGKKDPKTLAVVGCGEEGRRAIYGFLSQFPSLQSVRVCDISKDAMQVCMEQFGQRIKVIPCSDVRTAAMGSDLVLLVTTSKHTLFTENMAEPGMTVIGLNAFYDLDPAFASGRYKWFLGNIITDKEQIIEDPGLAANNLSIDNVAGDLGGVVTGRTSGRQSGDETIVFTHMGMGTLDLACANLAYHRAVEKGIGQTLVFKG